MIDDDLFHMYNFQRVIELLLVICIIGILIVTAVRSYLPCVDSARLTHTVGGASFFKARMDIMLYRAHHGEWPKDTEQAISVGIHKNYDEDSNYIDKIDIKDGAIDYHLSDHLKGKIVTLRPAVPSDDPLGPVIWIYGERESSTGWDVQGVNHTSVDEQYIPRDWR